MRTWRFLMIGLVLAGLLMACGREAGLVEIVRGSGNVVTEERPLSGFTAVSLQGVGRLEIDQIGSESVSISADDNLLPYIETRVRGGKLIISIQENTIFNDVTELIYQVTVKSIDSLELDGAGEIEVLHLDGEKWVTHLDGGGSVTVSGKVSRQEVEINGLGMYNAEDLTCQDATVEQNGAGMAVVQVSNTLDVTIAGVGSVEYIGNPTITQSLNGLGTVKRH
jgi:hypothetical protein